MKKQILLLSNFQIALILFVMSGLVVLLFWAIFPGGFQDTVASDYLAYYKPLALNIIQGGGLVMNGYWMMVYPPGFPILVAGFLSLSMLFNIQPIILMAVMILLFSAGSSVLMYFLGEIIWGKVEGVICSLLWMTYPFHIWLTKQPNSEPPFIFFFLLGLFLVLLVSVKRRPLFFLFLAGISIGFAMLIRPIGIGLGVILGLTYWLTSRNSLQPRIMGILLILTANLFSIFPWEYASYLHTGKIIPLSGSSSGALRLAFTYPIRLKSYQKEPISVPEDVRNLAQQIFNDSETISKTGDLAGMIINHLLEAPMPFLKLILIKFGRIWYSSDTINYDRFSLIIQSLYLTLFGASAYYSAKKTPHGKLPFQLIVPSLIYFVTLVMMGGVPLLRYMVPVISLLFLFTPAFILAIPSIQIAKKINQGKNLRITS